MLQSSDIIAFVPTRDRAAARTFFETTLGLMVVSEDDFAVVIDANGVMVRVVDVSGVPGFTPAPFTILGWQVSDIAAAVRGLLDRGVTFERFPGMDQDALGVWNAPGGAKVAWFKDPDGNILSLSQH